MKQLSKSQRRKVALAVMANEDVANLAKQFQHKRFNRFEDAINALYRGEDLQAFLADKRIAKVNELFVLLSAHEYYESRSFLREMLVHFSNTGSLVSGPEYIHAIYMMCKHRDAWVRDVFTWKPVAKQKSEQIRELTAHLFCNYQAPGFLYKAFLDEKEYIFVKWYIAIGTGKKLNELCNMPLPMTKRMLGFFLKAPAKYSITEALRWAQVKGMGGENRMAEMITYSWLGRKPFEDEQFWLSFLRIVTPDSEMGYNILNELVDYVREMRRRDTSYSLKGRTIASLLRQSNDWHNGLNGPFEHYSWPSSGINGMRLVKNDEEMMMEELTETKSMMEESRAMNHCVSSYSFYCAKGRSAIFSLRRYERGKLKERIATIEVNMATKSIVQAKAKMNKPISDEASMYIMIWKEKESLTVGRYL